jgi:hypothetical protein
MSNAVFGNVQSKFIFSVNANDAYYINEQMGGVLEKESFVTCPPYHAYAQIMVNNEMVGPFTIRTIKP